MARTDIDLAADGSTVADQAIDLQAGFRTATSEPPAQAHWQAVIGIGRRMQTVAIAKNRSVFLRVFLGIGGRLIPKTGCVAIDGVGPVGLQKALQGQCRSPPPGRRAS